MLKFDKYVYIIFAIVAVAVLVINTPEFFPDLFHSLAEAMGSIVKSAQDTAKTLKETPIPVITK